MNCRQAQHLLSRERDALLGPAERVALDAHLAECAGCRRIQSDLAAAAAAWRSADASVATPDPKAESLLLSATLDRQSRPSSRRTWRTPDHKWITIWSTGVMAAAIALTLIINRHPFRDGDDTVAAVVSARADYVELGDETATPVVYVDEDSGWLIVWAEGGDPATSG